MENGDYFNYCNEKCNNNKSVLKIFHTMCILFVEDNNQHIKAEAAPVQDGNQKCAIHG